MAYKDSMAVSIYCGFRFVGLYLGSILVVVKLKGRLQGPLSGSMLIWLNVRKLNSGTILATIKISANPNGHGSYIRTSVRPVRSDDPPPV